MAEWDSIADDLDTLTEALRAFDWTAAEQVVEAFIQRLNGAGEPPPPRESLAMLRELRRKRRFRSMELLADALLRAGRSEAEVHRQYAQAMIDGGNLTAAERELKSILDTAEPRERAEAEGLLGRIYKQLYVNANNPANARQRDNLNESISRYLRVYRQDPGKYLWQGVNVLALLSLAKRDEVPVVVSDVPDIQALTTQIGTRLRQIEEENGELTGWDSAIALELSVARGQHDEAVDHLRWYVRDTRQVDAFEINSTLRQLKEVWKLTAGAPPGDILLPGLQAALLKREGGGVDLNAADVHSGLQMNFSGQKDLSLQWWQTGLSRCMAVARIETLLGRKVGTAFLVDRKDFLNDPGQDPVLLTNWHVVSKDGEFPNSIAPDNAMASFDGLGKKYPIKKLLAYCKKLDASLISIEKLDPTAGHCPLKPTPAAFDETKKQRLYIIGHPGGRDLSFSIQDNFWLDTDGTFLHYRTPTEPGSSGSPVFDQENWTLMALHHAGKSTMACLNGKAGTYEANEGIAIGAIQAALRTNLMS